MNVADVSFLFVLIKDGILLNSYFPPFIAKDSIDDYKTNTLRKKTHLLKDICSTTVGLLILPFLTANLHSIPKIFKCHNLIKQLIKN